MSMYEVDVCVLGNFGIFQWFWNDDRTASWRRFISGRLSCR